MTREERNASRRERYREEHPPKPKVSPEEKRIKRNAHAKEYYQNNREVILAKAKERQRNLTQGEREWHNAKRRYRYKTDDEYRNRRIAQGKRKAATND